MVGVSSGGGLGQLGTLFTRGAIGSKTDAELLDLFASGEAAEAAFEGLVVRHGPDVLRACRRVLADPNDAEDAFQATFLVLARRASSRSIGRPDSLAPWLHGVALRVARKARVAAARRRRHERRVNARLETDSTSSHDLTGWLRDEVDRLPESLRTPVVLCYLEGMTYQGAAHRLGVSEGTIRGRLARARRHLRWCLGQHEEGIDRPPAEGQAGRDRPPRVPAALTAATTRAAMAFAPGGAGIAGISIAVAELMEGVLTMMLMTRWMSFAITLAAIGLAAGGAALSARADDPRAPAAAPKQESPKHVVGSQDTTAAAILTLDAAVERLVRNTAEDAVRLKIPRARADLLAIALTRPNLDIDALVIPDDPVSPSHPAGARQFDVNISHPVDVSQKRRARVHPAKTVAEAQYRDSLRNRLDGLYSAYVDVQRAQVRDLSSTADLARWDRLLKTARARAEQGRATGHDVGPIESAQQLARLRLSEARLTLWRTRRTLGLSLGFSAEEADHLDVERLVIDQPTIPSRESLVRLALQARPDLAALRLGVIAAEEAFTEATRPLKSDSAGVYELYQPYTFGDKAIPDRQSATSWALGVTVPLPLYNRNQGNIVRARVNLEQARVQLAALEKAIDKEIGERRSDCESGYTRFRGNFITLQRARKAAREAERRYESGEGGAEAVVTTSNDLPAAELQHVSHMYHHRRSFLALNTAVGIRLFP